MIYFYYGADVVRGRKTAFKLLTTAQAKHPESSRFNLSADDPQIFAKLPELILGQTLFYHGHLVLADRLFADDRLAAWLTDHLLDIANVASLFVFWEDEVSDRLLKLVSPIAKEVKHFSLPLATKPAVINPFAVSDALLRRDKKKLWLEFDMARRQGEEEAVFWKLHWQVKMMLLTQVDGRSTLPEIKPLVVSKARQGAKQFSGQELINQFRRLNDIYHQTFIGTPEFAVALERFILEL